MDVNQLANNAFSNDALEFNANQAKIWTTLPGVIVEFFPLTQTASVRPAIQMKRFVSQLNNLQPISIDVSLPMLLDCPVQFSSGGGVTLTFPISNGDECLIVFSSRCIDAWWYQGLTKSGPTDFNPVPQTTMRMHDLSDGFVIPGIKSVPKVIPNISTTAAQLRSDDGTTSISLASGTKEIDVVSTSAITMNAPAVFITGTFYVNGDTIFDGTVTANGHSIDETHLHSNVTSGSSNTGAVV